MVETLISKAAENGVWALLFVFLLIYEISENKKREAKYQTTIDSLNKEILCAARDSNRLIEDVNADVAVVDDKLQKIEGKVDTLDHKVDRIIDKVDSLDAKM